MKQYTNLDTASIIEVSFEITGLIMSIITFRSSLATTPGKSINVRFGFCGPEIVTFIGFGMNLQCEFLNELA